MSDLTGNPASSPSSAALEDTVWELEIAFIDSVPRWIAMTFVFLVFIGSWQIVTAFGFVSRVVLRLGARVFRAADRAVVFFCAMEHGLARVFF